MSYPRIGVYSPVLDQSDDPREITGQGIARGEKVHLLSMKGGVDEGYFLRCDADVYERSRVCYVFHGVGHGAVVARGVGHDVEEVAARNSFDELQLRAIPLEGY